MNIGLHGIECAVDAPVPGLRQDYVRDRFGCAQTAAQATIVRTWYFEQRVGTRSTRKTPLVIDSAFPSLQVTHRDNPNVQKSSLPQNHLTDAELLLFD